MTGSDSRPTTSNDTAISVAGLTVRRGSNSVFDNLNLTIAKGKITGLLGPSGCGKTTLMRVIVGVQKITDGDVRVFGQKAGSAGLREQIGYVTQDVSVYDDLSVEQNLTYFARILGLPDSRTSEVAATVGLEDQLGSLVRNMSGGQRSRVSLAVALLGHPPLLILDEPTVGLDPLLRKELWDLFDSLAAAGTTLLISSHVMDEAARCDRLMLMREGKILSETTVPELLASTEAHDVEGAFLALITHTTSLPLPDLAPNLDRAAEATEPDPEAEGGQS